MDKEDKRKTLYVAAPVVSCAFGMTTDEKDAAKRDARLEVFTSTRETPVGYTELRAHDGLGIRFN
jgi:hypothetical protein